MSREDLSVLLLGIYCDIGFQDEVFWKNDMKLFWHGEKADVLGYPLCWCVQSGISCYVSYDAPAALECSGGFWFRANWHAPDIFRFAQDDKSNVATFLFFEAQIKLVSVTSQSTKALSLGKTHCR